MGDHVEEDLEENLALLCVTVIDEPVKKRGPAEVFDLVCKKKESEGVSDDKQGGWKVGGRGGSKRELQKCI